MPVPITPTPARPVDDAVIETGWGQWVHDVALALPRGCVFAGTAPGVNFATLTPDQFSKVFPATAGRCYLVNAWAQWRADSSNNTVAWGLHVNGVAQPSIRQTNAFFAGGVSTETAQVFMWVNPNISGSCSLRLVGTRANGTGTITVSSPWQITVYDMGATAGLPSTSLREMLEAATDLERPSAELPEAPEAKPA